VGDMAVAAPADLSGTHPAVETAEAVPSTTPMTRGNKFEPGMVGSAGSTTAGGQNHSGPVSIGHDIGSALSKIVKDVKKAVTHE